MNDDDTAMNDASSTVASTDDDVARAAPNQDVAVASIPTPPVSTPAIADDVDLIEKEWVEKAKAIVESTHGDPYTQSKQLNKMKADYIKKRYNRDVKVDE